MSKKYQPQILENYSLYWTNTDMKYLESRVKAGDAITEIAIALGRTAPACKARLGIIRTADMFYYGDPEDTAATWRKKLKLESVDNTLKTEPIKSDYDSTKGVSRVKIVGETRKTSLKVPK